MADRRKTPKKTPKRKREKAKPGSLAPPSPKNGNQLPTGVGSHGGGKKGRSGRRPAKITALARELIDKNKLLNELSDIAIAVQREETKDRIAAIKVLLEYGYGRPMQLVGGGTDAPSTFTLQLGIAPEEEEEVEDGDE